MIDYFILELYDNFNHIGCIRAMCNQQSLLLYILCCIIEYSKIVIIMIDVDSCDNTNPVNSKNNKKQDGRRKLQLNPVNFRKSNCQ